MIEVTCGPTVPPMDIDAIVKRWPRSMVNLAAMGVNDGTLLVEEDFGELELRFRFRSNVELVWSGSGWETDWGTVR